MKTASSIYYLVSSAIEDVPNLFQLSHFWNANCARLCTYLVGVLLC